MRFSLLLLPLLTLGAALPPPDTTAATSIAQHLPTAEIGARDLPLPPCPSKAIKGFHRPCRMVDGSFSEGRVPRDVAGKEKKSKTTENGMLLPTSASVEASHAPETVLHVLSWSSTPMVLSSSSAAVATTWDPVPTEGAVEDDDDELDERSAPKHHREDCRLEPDGMRCKDVRARADEESSTGIEERHLPPCPKVPIEGHHRPCRIVKDSFTGKPTTDRPGIHGRDVESIDETAAMESTAEVESAVAAGKRKCSNYGKGCGHRSHRRDEASASAADVGSIDETAATETDALADSAWRRKCSQSRGKICHKRHDQGEETSAPASEVEGPEDESGTKTWGPPECSAENHSKGCKKVTHHSSRDETSADEPSDSPLHDDDEDESSHPKSSDRGCFGIKMRFCKFNRYKCWCINRKHW